MSRTRKFYYWLVGKISSDVELVHNFTGFRPLRPRSRRAVPETPTSSTRTSAASSATSATSEPRSTYVQPARKPGPDEEQLLQPLRHGDARASPTTPRCRCAWPRWPGFAISVVSLLVAIGYLVAKLLFWDQLELGLAPLLIGIYFFGAVQLFFIGVLGEYIGVDPHPGPQATARRREGAHQLRTGRDRRIASTRGARRSSTSGPGASACRAARRGHDVRP